MHEPCDPTTSIALLRAQHPAPCPKLSKLVRGPASLWPSRSGQLKEVSPPRPGLGSRRLFAETLYEGLWCRVQGLGVQGSGFRPRVELLSKCRIAQLRCRRSKQEKGARLSFEESALGVSGDSCGQFSKSGSLSRSL